MAFSFASAPPLVKNTLEKPSGARAVINRAASARVTVQTLGPSRELHGVLAVGTQAPLRGAERDLVTSVIALASIALDQTRTIEEARRRLRTGLFELMLSGASEVAASTATRLWGRLPAPPLRVLVLAAPPPSRALLAELAQFSERNRGRLFFAEHNERTVVIVQNGDTAALRKILARHHAAAGGSSPVSWPQLAIGLAEAVRAAERTTADRDFVQFSELAAEGMLGLLESAGGGDVADACCGRWTRCPSQSGRCCSMPSPSGWNTTAPGIQPRGSWVSTGTPSGTGFRPSTGSPVSTSRRSPAAPSCGRRCSCNGEGMNRQSIELMVDQPHRHNNRTNFL
jgi:hypothetical protein